MTFSQLSNMEQGAPKSNCKSLHPACIIPLM
nr:MAG TPA: hypothetical protein [Caudoviricetes sp.]